MGMIDLTPDEYENGAIYDDGAVLTEGFWNGFVYECESAEESYEKLINKVWDAGYRGEPIGNGTIVEADEIDDLIGEYVGRIYICINNSPQYTIKETINIEDKNEKDK